jgi:hypothetical protein
LIKRSGAPNHDHGRNRKPRFTEKYLDQALKVLTPKESPSAEKIFNYSLARKISTELDATGWKPGK